MVKKIIINFKEIETLYKECCKQENIKFSENHFVKFLDFLQIDFYDWIKGNLKYFQSEQNIAQSKDV